MTPVTERMKKDGLIKQAGKSLGVDVTVEWSDFPNGGTIRDALVSGDLDIGSVGNTPTLVGLSHGVPLHILSIAEGRDKFLITLPKDSPIKTLDGLKNKKAGLILGSDMEFFLNSLSKFSFGTSEYKQLGINAVGLQTLTQLAAPPKGVDFTSDVVASYLLANQQGLNKALVNSYGYTEDAYDGPLGTGAGHALPNLEDSPYYPEGIYLHRNFWLVTDTFLKTGSEPIEAFLIAQQQAEQELNSEGAEAVAESVQDIWKLDPKVGAQVWKDDLNGMRGWPWITEGDMRAVVDQSQLAADAGLIDQPLTWADVIENITPVAPIAQHAWQTSGFPDAAEFTKVDGVKDLRGPPMWDHEKWRQ